MAGLAVADANALVSAEARNTAYTGPSTLYVSLHTADPGATGASEVSGGSYARQAVTFAAPSGGTASNSGVLNFTGMPAVTVTHISLWDAASAGTFHQSGALTSSVVVASGNTLQFAAGAITFNVSAV